MTKGMNTKHNLKKHYCHPLLVPIIHLMNSFTKWPFVEAFSYPSVRLDHPQLQGFHSSLQSLPAFYKEHFKMLWKKICFYILKLLRVKWYSWKLPEAHLYTEVINSLLICLI